MTINGKNAINLPYSLKKSLGGNNLEKKWRSIGRNSKNSNGYSAACDKMICVSDLMKSSKKTTIIADQLCCEVTQTKDIVKMKIWARKFLRTVSIKTTNHGIQPVIRKNL